MRSTVNWPIALLCTLIPQLLFAAEFDCKKASMASDYVICSHSDLIDANSVLANAWLTSRSDMGGDEKQASLKDQQIWLRRLNSQCGLPSRGRPSDDVILNSRMCVLNRIKARAEELQQIKKLKSAAETSEKTYRFPNTPVKIIASLENNIENGEEVVFRIGNGVIPQLVHSYFPEIFWPEADKRLTEKVIYRPPYIFVFSDSGGNCWDCSGVAIFKLAQDTVIRIGDLGGQDSATLTQNRKDYFVTPYSKLESAKGFCHACSPWFRIVLKDVNDELLVDGEATWAINQALWEKNNQTFKRNANLGKSADLEERMTWDNEIFPALVSNAALAKYCRKNVELAELIRFAKSKLDEESRQRLDENLDLVNPLETPAIWNTHAPY